MKMRVICSWLMALAPGSLLSSVALKTAAGQGQNASPARPSVIDSTYVVTTFLGTETVHLYEEDGRLRWDGKLKVKEKYKALKDSESSESIEYDKVIFVEYKPSLGPDGRGVQIVDSHGLYRTVPLPAEGEGEGLAEYVARKSPVGLELIGRAWRIRKPFQCPEGGQLGCRDFKDLLDHGDADIAEYFYSRDENTHAYACFRSEESFFIVQYDHFMDFGTLIFEEFQNQQSTRNEYGEIRWLPNGTGFITESKVEVKRGAQPQRLGTIDLSSLSYQTKFSNRENTLTQYSLSVRWSTRRFTENFSGKDKKGETWNFDKTGVCTKLN